MGVESGMAMGTKQAREKQEDLFYASERTETAGHPFYEQLNRVLDEARSLIEMPITLPPLPDIFSSSPIVDCSNLRGEDPGPSPPISLVVSSETLLTRFWLGQSHHSFLTMALSAGVAPERNVE